MTLPFHIAHTTNGRTRIRWMGDASEKVVINDIAAQITGLEGVEQAVPRIATGSIIIEHDQSTWSAIQSQLTDRLSLVFMTPAPVPAHTGLESLNRKLAQVDGTLKGINTDLRSLTVFMLSVLAITQALRGQVMVSSASLLWYAFSVASKARTSGSTPLDSAADIAD